MRREGNMSDSGQEAVRSGNVLHEMVATTFRCRNVPVIDYGSGNGDTRDMFSKKVLVRDDPYTSIYGCKTKSDFVFAADSVALLRIECVAQHSTGTVDEKFPYLFHNAKDAMPERHVWIILDGNGMRPGARSWLKRQVGSGFPSKEIRVLSVAEAQAEIKKLIDLGHP